MFVCALEATCFGVLGEHFSCEFTHHGINVVRGGNESGKSTLFRCFGAALHGMSPEQVRSIQTWGTQGPVSVRLRFQTFEIHRHLSEGTVELRRLKGDAAETLYAGPDQAEFLKELEKLGGPAEDLSSTVLVAEGNRLPSLSPFLLKLFQEAPLPEREQARGHLAIEVGASTSELGQVSSELERAQEELKLARHLAEMQSGVDALQQQAAEAAAQLQAAVQEADRLDGLLASHARLEELASRSRELTERHTGFEPQVRELRAKEEEWAAAVRAREEAAQSRSSLTQRLESLEALLAEEPAFGSLSPDFPDRLRELQQVRAELSRQSEESSNLQAEIATLEAAREHHVRAASLPDNFPERLDALRARRQELQSRMADLGRQMDRSKTLSFRARGLSRQLEEKRPLLEQDGTFPDRLWELQEKREALQRVQARVAELEDRQSLLEGRLEAEFQAFQNMPEDYADRVERLRDQIRESRQEERELERQRARRQELEAELEHRQRRLDDEHFATSRTADVPERLRELYALRETRDRLMDSVNGLMDHIRVLEKRQESEFPAFAALPPGVQSHLHRTARQDVITGNLLVKLAGWSDRAREAEQASRSLESAAPQSAADHLAPDFPQRVAEYRQIQHEVAVERDRQQRLAAQVEEARARLQGDFAFELQGSEDLQHRIHRLTALRREVKDQPEDNRVTILAKAQETLENMDKLLATEFRGLQADDHMQLVRLSRILEREDDLEKLQQELDALRAELEATARTRGKKWPFKKGDDADTLLEARIAWVEERLAATRGKVERLRTEANLPSQGDVHSLVGKFRRCREAQQRRLQAEATVEALKALSRGPRGHADRQSEIAHLARTIGLKDKDQPVEPLLARLQECHQLQDSLRDLERQHRHASEAVAALEARLHALRQQLGAMADADDATLADAVEGRGRSTTLAIQQAEARARADALQLPPDVEALCARLKRALTARLRQTHLEAAPDGPADLEQFLAFQAVTVELHDLRHRLDQVLKPGEHDNELERVEKQLNALEEALSPGVVGTSLEEALSRHTAYQAEAAALTALQSQVVAIPPRDELEARLGRLQASLRDEMEPLGIAAADADLDHVQSRYRDYRGVVAERDAVQESLQDCLHAEDATDVRVVLQDRVQALEGSLGPWAQVLTSEAVDAAIQDFKQAITLEAELRRVMAEFEGLPPVDRLEDQHHDLDVEMHLMFESSGIEEDEAVDDTLLNQWREHRSLLARTAAARARLQEIQLDQLAARAAELAESVGPFADIEDTAPAIERFEAWSERQREKLEAAASRDAIPPDDVLEAAREDAGSALAAGRATLARALQEALDEVAATRARILESQPQLATPETEAWESALAEARGRATPRQIEWEALDTAARHGQGTVDAFRQDHPQVRPVPEIEDLLREKQAKQAALEEATAAATTALQQFDEATRCYRRDLGERCRERASDILRGMTRGRYERMWIDDDGQAWVKPAQGPEAALSSSTHVADQVGLWWRVAVCLELGRSHPWPLVLDESLSHLDDYRRSRTFELLSEVARDRQVILLTLETHGVRPDWIVRDLEAITV